MLSAFPRLALQRGTRLASRETTHAPLFRHDDHSWALTGPSGNVDIAADRDGPELGGGVIKADNIQAAVALVDHPDVNVCPLMDDFLWPKGATGAVVWDKPPLS